MLAHETNGQKVNIIVYPLYKQMGMVQNLLYPKIDHFHGEKDDDPLELGGIPISDPKMPTLSTCKAHLAFPLGSQDP